MLAPAASIAPFGWTPKAALNPESLGYVLPLLLPLLVPPVLRSRSEVSSCQRAAMDTRCTGNMLYCRL